jgi:hypothetical protein
MCSDTFRFGGTTDFVGKIIDDKSYAFVTNTDWKYGDRKEFIINTVCKGQFQKIEYRRGTIKRR